MSGHVYGCRFLPVEISYYIFGTVPTMWHFILCLLCISFVLIVVARSLKNNYYTFQSRNNKSIFNPPKYVRQIYFDESSVRGRVMVLNATFNNITGISWRSILLVKETVENHRPVASH